MTRDLTNANRSPAFFRGVERVVRVMSVLRRGQRATSRPMHGPARRSDRAVGGSRVGGSVRARKPDGPARGWRIARGIHAPALRAGTGCVPIFVAGVRGPRSTAESGRASLAPAVPEQERIERRG